MKYILRDIYDQYTNRGIFPSNISPGKDKREDRLMLCGKPSAVNNLTHLLGAIAETDVIQQVGGSMGHCKSPSGTQTSMLPSKFLDIFVGDTTKKTGEEASAID